MSLQIPRTVAAGSFSVTLKGTSGTLTHTAALTLAVTSAADFALNVSPTQLAATTGAGTAPVIISIAGQNGFSDSVSVSLSGLPSGFTSQPASPFTMTPGHNQSLTISVPGSAAIDDFTLQVEASSGSLTRTATLALTLMQTRAYDNGYGTLYLETTTRTDVTRVGLQKSWGGSIVEVSFNGNDYVNNDDPGRQVQTSLWDGNAEYSFSWGYNPIEAGDHFFNGSPLLDYSLVADSIYTKTQPIQWAPENFGAPYGSSVLGDAYIEKWISVVPGYSRVFKVHYRITHFGSDAHAEAAQELPVVYVNPTVSNFFYYSGNAPWTNSPLSQHTMPLSCCDNLHTPEQWGAYVDNSNIGLAVYTPMQFPESKGFNAGSTLQFTPLCPISWDPGLVLDFDTYILVGPLEESRTAIYALHSQQTGPSLLPPYGYMDLPQNGATFSGTNNNVEGWSWSLSSITSMDVLVDGAKVGSATTGIDLDITGVYPGAPTNVGFKYSLDSTQLSNGLHTIVIKVSDADGHVATYRTAQVTVAN